MLPLTVCGIFNMMASVCFVYDCSFRRRLLNTYDVFDLQPVSFTLNHQCLPSGLLSEGACRVFQLAKTRQQDGIVLLEEPLGTDASGKDRLPTQAPLG